LAAGFAATCLGAGVDFPFFACMVFAEGATFPFGAGAAFLAGFAATAFFTGFAGDALADDLMFFAATIFPFFCGTDLEVAGLLLLGAAFLEPDPEALAFFAGLEAGFFVVAIALCIFRY